MKRIFLGGTCNNSTWREELIPLLSIDYFNPVVENWTAECQEEEILQRKTCDYCLYVITPEMTGFYSIAEVVDDSNKRPSKTIFCVLNDESKGYELFNKHQLKSLIATSKLVSENGGFCTDNLQSIANYVNGVN
jgi:hypothetical protein